MENIGSFYYITKIKIAEWGVVGLRIVTLIISFYVARRIIDHVLTRYTQKALDNNTPLHLSESSLSVIRTVAPIVASAVHFFLAALTILLVLSELKVNIMPIVYSLSILGLAFSIGSQTLVKDLINGFLTLVEGNIAVGDYITIKGNKGLVETMSLRCIHLRHGTGELETIPFSEVNQVINHSRQFNSPLFSCTVAYDADLKAVESAFLDAFNSVSQNPNFSSLIQGDFKILGVSKLGPSGGATVEASVTIAPDPGQKFTLAFYQELMKSLKKRKVPMPVCACCVGQNTSTKP